MCRQSAICRAGRTLERRSELREGLKRTAQAMHPATKKEAMITVVQPEMEAAIRVPQLGAKPVITVEQSQTEVVMTVVRRKGKLAIMGT